MHPYTIIIQAYKNTGVTLPKVVAAVSKLQRQYGKTVPLTEEEITKIYHEYTRNTN